MVVGRKGQSLQLLKILPLTRVLVRTVVVRMH